MNYKFILHKVISQNNVNIQRSSYYLHQTTLSRWQLQKCIKKVNSYIAQYPVLTTVQSALH